MSRNLIILIIIFAVLIGLAMFVLIPDRDNNDATPEDVGEVDPEVAAQQTAAAVVAAAAGATDGKTTEIRNVENRAIQVVFTADKQFETESERNGFAPRPADTTEQQPENPQPVVTVVVDQAPTLTPVPQVQQPVVTGRSGDPIIFTSYTVTGGETMYSLSQRTDFNTSIGLMALYGIDTSDFFQGNVLNIPIVNPGYCTNARAAHLILEGENVFRIADTYGTTQEAIQAANSLAADYRIKTNEVLCIP